MTGFWNKMQINVLLFFEVKTRIGRTHQPLIQQLLTQLLFTDERARLILSQNCLRSFLNARYCLPKTSVRPVLQFYSKCLGFFIYLRNFFCTRSVQYRGGKNSSPGPNLARECIQTGSLQRFEYISVHEMSLY